jgi:hypothetical protein
MPASLPDGELGIVEVPVGAGAAWAAAGGEPLFGREAISTPLAGKPVNVDVPPGRYWPAGEVMRTVAAADGDAGAELAADDDMAPYRSGSALAAAIFALAAGTADAAGDADGLTLAGVCWPPICWPIE